MKHVTAMGTTVLEDEDIVDPRPVANPHVWTIDKHIAVARREMGKQRWAELNAEWER